MKSLRGFILLAFLSNAACTTLYMHPEGSRNSYTDQKFWKNEFLFGWIEAGEPFQVERVCGDSGVETLKIEKSVPQVAIGLISLGIYTPNTIAVSCRSTSN